MRHAIADLDAGPLAHLPSGAFHANGAWLVLAAMAHNLLRAAATRTGTPYAKARTATIRRELITMPARTARHGRGNLILHLPAGHHREQAWLNLWARACGRPARRSGLTSPDPVTHPHAARHTAPSPRPGDHGQPHKG
jgi:hypothetical protein